MQEMMDEKKALSGEHLLHQMLALANKDYFLWQILLKD